MTLPYQILTGDFNRDGNIDLVLLGENYNGGDVTLFLGAGHGTFSGTPHFSHAYMGSGVVLDINGDGASDLAGTNSKGVIRLLNSGYKGR